jgi:hypothetical protein
VPDGGGKWGTRDSDVRDRRKRSENECAAKVMRGSRRVLLCRGDHNRKRYARTGKAEEGKKRSEQGEEMLRTDTEASKEQSPALIDTLSAMKEYIPRYTSPASKKRQLE